MSYLEYIVIIKDDATSELTSGRLIKSSIDFQPPENFIGERVTILTKNEDGMTQMSTGILLEVLEG
jgi:hypothetical protein